MAGQSWSIIIGPSDTGAIIFTPDVFGAAPGSQLQAQVNDLVSWNNQTGDPHELVTDQGVALCDPIDTWMSSTPDYLLVAPTPTPVPPFPFDISYHCKTHPNETGVIHVIS